MCASDLKERKEKNSFDSCPVNLLEFERPCLSRTLEFTISYNLRMKNLIELTNFEHFLLSFSFFILNDILFYVEKLTRQCQRRYCKAS